MEKKVVKRGGRPNRGGGRGDRGGGARGRGRGNESRGRGRGAGRGQQGGPGAKPQPTQTGHGGRKGGADFMADYDDDMYDDEYDDGDDTFSARALGSAGPRPEANTYSGPAMRGVPSQRGRGGSSGSSRGNSSERGRGGSSVGSRGNSSGNFVRRNPVKMTMQQVNMSSANQEMVKDMLRDLHGEDQDSEDIEEYDELDTRAENQYWMTGSQMQIVETSINPAVLEGDTDVQHQDGTISSLAVNKLARYGFHKKRCRETLHVCDGDVGLSLEFLITHAFGLQASIESDEQLMEDAAEILEQRSDEMMALQSIYEDRFRERIQNKVWILKLSLPYLETMAFPKQSKKEGFSFRKETEMSKEVCRFYSRGFCKFGRRCRMIHNKPTPIAGANLVHKEINNPDNEFEYEIEIRFPDGNKYPREPPCIAFSTISRLDKHICLNITKHMMQEAKTMAKDQEPSIFTVVSMLDDETFLDKVVTEPPHDFSCSPTNIAWMKGENDQDSDDTQFNNADGIDLALATSSMLKMSANDSRDEDRTEKIEVKRCTSKEEVRRSNPAEILRNNKRLVEDFKKKKNSSKYQSMQRCRKKLPAWDKQNDILSIVESNQVVVISGMTGCGKTTQVPQFILDLYLDSGDLHLCNILCTQPRRISAMAVAERVAEERSDTLGRIVGYQIRLEKMQSAMTRLLFCTTGIVLRRLEGDNTLDGVTHLIIDEVHERSEESDFLLMYLRDMLSERPDLKIILMSATMNAQLFSDYFGGCPVVDIPGRTFPVDQYFLEDVIDFTRFVMDESSPYARPLKHMNAVRRGLDGQEEGIEEESYYGSTNKASDRVQDQNLAVKQLFLRYSDYHKSTVKSLAMMDHTKINFDLILDLMSWLVSGNHDDLEFPDNGAILVFMPGFAEIQTLYDLLQSSQVFGHRNRHKFRIIPLHSTLSSEDQHAVFSTPPEGITKIVIATNIAETSITIDDVCFVIDTGKMKEKRYDPTKGMESLEMVWVSRANATQRKGRAGRVRAGVSFHLFTSNRFQHHLLEQPIPEIQRAPLEQIVLRIRMLDIFSTTQVQEVLNQLPEPPDNEAITSAIERLEVLGALDDKGELTPLGYHLGTLPVDVRIGKLMLFGAIFRCLDAALTIAACLSFKSPFVSPFGKKHEADEKRLEFAAGNSDHLTMLNAYNGWLEAKKRGGKEAYHFCQDYFLSSKSLQMLSSMKQQFVELLSDIGFVREGISSRDVERSARQGGDGVISATGDEANLNSSNKKLVAAILVGALFPNVVQVLTPEQQYAQTGGGAVAIAPKTEDIRFKTKPDGYVKIHPSSVNFQVRYYESPYLVYHEKVKTTQIYIRDCTMVSVYPLLLFGGGQIGVDLSRGNFILSVDDGWIRFQAATHQIAELVRELRAELDQLLSDKIQTPHMDLCTCPRGSKIINTIVKLITTQ